MASMASPPMIEAARGKTLFRASPFDVRVIGVDTKHKPGEHHLATETQLARCASPLNEALVLNIMAVGVKKPIHVEPGDDRVPEVVDGCRRVLHAREACKRLVAAGQPPIELMLLCERSDVATSLMTRAVGNEFSLRDSLLGRAKTAKAMLDRGISIENVALSFDGVHVETIKKWKTLAEAPADLLALIDLGIAPSVVIKAASQPEEAQRAIVEAVKGNGHTHTRRFAPVEPDVEPPAEDAVDDVVNRKTKPKASKKKVTVAAVTGARGKKFFKGFASDFVDYLPAEFVLGIQFAIGAVADEDLPKGIRTQLDGWRAMVGEIDPETLAVGIRRQVIKMYGAFE